MSNAWSERVAIYLDQIAQNAATIESILDGTQLEATGDDCGKVQESTRRLEQALIDLEHRIAEREELLRAPDAPAEGATLAEKLSGTGNDKDALLAMHCKQIADTIELNHHRAISVFVCQYHLAELSTELVRVMVGASVPATYGESNRAGASPGGGLFNESA